MRVLAGMPHLVDVLLHPNPQALKAANGLLDLFKKTLDVDVCYLMDAHGNTVASSNRNDPDSFVGMNFSFRPYYQDAMQGLPSQLFSPGHRLAETGGLLQLSGLPEKFRHPAGHRRHQGLHLFRGKGTDTGGNQHPTGGGSSGVIFISSRAEWLYQLLWPLNAGRHQPVAANPAIRQRPLALDGDPKKGA